MTIELRNSVRQSVLSIVLTGWVLVANAGGGGGLQERSRIDWVESSLQVVDTAIVYSPHYPGSVHAIEF